MVWSAWLQEIHETVHSAANNHEDCRHLGTFYGGFFAPLSLTDIVRGDVAAGDSPLIYSFGAGEDISFDVVLLSMFPNATIRIFDPTPRAARHIKAVQRTLQTGKIPLRKGIDQKDQYRHYIDDTTHDISSAGVRIDALEWFREVRDMGSSLCREGLEGGCNLTHVSLALEGSDSTLRFAPIAPPRRRARRDGVSMHTLRAGDNDTNINIANNRTIEVKALTLGSIMLEMGDTRLPHIMKIDIEGAEIRVIPDMLRLFEQHDKKEWPKVLFFDFDCLLTGHVSYNRTEGYKALRSLLHVGYKLFAAGRPSLAEFTMILEQ
jgi:FkbM family methyltransferase